MGYLPPATRIRGVTAEIFWKLLSKSRLLMPWALKSWRLLMWNMVLWTRKLVRSTSVNRCAQAPSGGAAWATQCRVCWREELARGRSAATKRVYNTATKKQFDRRIRHELLQCGSKLSVVFIVFITEQCYYTWPWVTVKGHFKVILNLSLAKIYILPTLNYFIMMRIYACPIPFNF